jgi:membrane protease YdiL (CAAX protease family)
MNHVGSKLQFILFIAAFFALWTLRATWLFDIDRSIKSPETRTAYSTLVKILLWVVPAVLYVYKARKTNPIRYLGLSASPAIKTWAISLLAICAFCALILVFEIFIGHKRLSLGVPSAAGLPFQIAIFVVSPFVEELFFRGLVLHELSTFMRPVFSNIAASFLFVGIHLPHWISSGIPPQEIARTSLGILMFSLLAGWLFSLSKSIWPPTAAHIANNILSSLISAG